MKKKVCLSISLSIGLLVHNAFFFIAEFKPKSDLTSINAPAQRAWLILPCIRPCCYRTSFVGLFIVVHKSTISTLLTHPTIFYYSIFMILFCDFLVAWTRFYKALCRSVHPLVRRSRSAGSHCTLPTHTRLMLLCIRPGNSCWFVGWCVSQSVCPSLYRVTSKFCQRNC